MCWMNPKHHTYVRNDNFEQVRVEIEIKSDSEIRYRNRKSRIEIHIKIKSKSCPDNVNDMEHNIRQVTYSEYRYLLRYRRSLELQNPHNLQRERERESKCIIDSLISKRML